MSKRYDRGALMKKINDKKFKEQLREAKRIDKIFEDKV